MNFEGSKFTIQCEEVIRYQILINAQYNLNGI